MKLRYIIPIITLLLSFISCSSLKEAPVNENRVLLNESNFTLIEGAYNINSADNGGTNLIMNIFGGGYKSFKYDGDTSDSLCYVQFKVLNKNTLGLSYTTKNSEIKNTKIKGKLKDGYFVLKQSHMLLPFIFTNLYRNRKLRIGLLENGNLITDHNQISLGTFMIILPYYFNDKCFNIEFEKIEDGLE